MLRARPREDVDVANPLLQCRSIHLLDLRAGGRRFPVAYSEHPGDGGRGDLVIPGNHRHPDAARMALGYGLDRFRPRWIEQPDQAEQNQVLRQIRRTKVPGVDPRIF